MRKWKSHVTLIINERLKKELRMPPAVATSPTPIRPIDPLYLPLIVGLAAGTATWAGLVTVVRLAAFYPSLFAAGIVGSGGALALYASERLAPLRSSFELRETPEHPELRAWLFYWIVIILLVFGFAASGLILSIGLAIGGPLVVGVGVPMTTIYFLFLLSRYSTRSFSRDVREPLHALSTHIERMDAQSAELNKLVGGLVGATSTLSNAVERLVALEKQSPERKLEELKQNLPHLWFRAIGSVPANVAVEIENRGDLGVISDISLDAGYGIRRIGWNPRRIAPKERLKLDVASMDKKTKGLQLRIECETQSIPPGKTVVQVAAFSCTQLKSGWGTPQGVDISPAEPQDGMKGVG